MKTPIYAAPAVKGLRWSGQHHIKMHNVHHFYVKIGFICFLREIMLKWTLYFELFTTQEDKSIVYTEHG